MSKTTTHVETESFFGPVISTYTRAQAHLDGNLVNVGAMAGEAGFRWPVSLTAAAWADCVAWSEDDSRRQTARTSPGGCGTCCSWPPTRSASPLVAATGCCSRSTGYKGTELQPGPSRLP